MLLIIGGKAESHARYFERLEAGGVFRCAECMPFEDGLTIWVARGPKVPIEKAWPPRPAPVRGWRWRYPLTEPAVRPAT